MKNPKSGMQGWNEQRELRLRQLSQAVEQAPHTVMITDHEARVEYVNPRFTKLTGYEPREIIGKKPTLLKSGKTPRRAYEQLWEALTAGREWKGEFLNRKKNGELYWEAASIAPLKDPDGRITHYVGVLEDVTDRKKLEALRNELMGRISHEIRTPLTVIKWSVRNLEDGLSGPLSGKQRAMLSGINRSVSRLEKIINEVLDLSRLESGRFPVKQSVFDFSTLVHEAIENFRLRLDKKTLSIVEDISDHVTLEADPDKILQVLNNLIENALRFARNVIAVKGCADGDFLRVSVIDDGPGIELADQEKLFSKFERLSQRGTREEYRGTGLGLAICREIILQHGGKIWVESIPGQGAGFHFKIPLGRMEPKQEEQAHDAA